MNRECDGCGRECQLEEMNDVQERGRYVATVCDGCVKEEVGGAPSGDYKIFRGERVGRRRGDY